MSVYRTIGPLVVDGVSIQIVFDSLGGPKTDPLGTPDRTGTGSEA